MEGISGPLQVELADLIVPKQVAVVQELDLGKLESILQAIVDAINLNSADHGDEQAPTKQDVESLRTELQKLREDSAAKDMEIKHLKDAQDKLRDELGEKIDKSSLDPQVVHGIIKKQEGQEERLDKLDGQGGNSSSVAGNETDTAGKGRNTGLLPRVDFMNKEIGLLRDAVKAAKDAADDAGARAALALQSVGGGSPAQAEGLPSGTGGEKTSKGLSAAMPESIDATALASASAGGPTAATVARVESLALDLNALARTQKDLQDRLAKHVSDQESQVRSLKDTQDGLRKASRETANAAADARSSSDLACNRIAEAEAHLASMRSAVEALSKGEKIQIPPPIPAPAAVDLGPLERLVSQKAYAEDLQAAERRLEELEVGLREAREVADKTAREGMETDRVIQDLKDAISSLRASQQPPLPYRPGSGGLLDALPETTSTAGVMPQPEDQAEYAAGAQEHHNHHHHTNSTKSSNLNELSEIRSEMRELKSSIETLLGKAQGAAKAGDLSCLAAEVDALRTALEGKASQSDIDAFLSGGAGFTLGSTVTAAHTTENGGAGPRETASADEVDPGAATAESLAVKLNEMKVQLSQLQGFLAVLQGRMDSKASTDDIKFLQRSHQSVSEKISIIEKRLEEVSKESSITKELSNQISRIEKRLAAMEGSRVMPMAVPPQHKKEAGISGLATSSGAMPLTAVNASKKHAIPETAEVAGTLQGFQALESGLQHAMAEIADLRSVISDLSTLRSMPSSIEKLREEVEAGMPSLTEGIATLHNLLAAKADKAELDVLLEAGAVPGAVSASGEEVQNGESAGLKSSADTSEIVAMLNELAGRVASLSTTQKVLTERLSRKADATTLDAKANRESVAKLEASLASKASQDILTSTRDELARLKSQIAALQQHETSGAALSTTPPSSRSTAPAGPGYSISERLSCKADREEVKELRRALEGLATKIGVGKSPRSPDTSLHGHASMDENSRSGSRSRPRSPMQSSTAVDSKVVPVISSHGLDERLAAIEGAIDGLTSAIEIVAHAANILAIGEAHAVTPTGGQTNVAGKQENPGIKVNGSNNSDGEAGHRHGAVDAHNQHDPMSNKAADNSMRGERLGGLASAKDGVCFGRDGFPHGAVDKLREVYLKSYFNRKMDWFDPEWLQDLARRVGDMENSIRALKKTTSKPPPSSGSDLPGRSAGGQKDYDKMIMKLGRDIAGLKKQLGDIVGSGAGGGMLGGGGGLVRVPDGDHAMLSSKPLLGYRCMACDRPLEKLDEKPGPYVPSNQMPVSVAPYERRGIGLPVTDQAPSKQMHPAVPSSDILAARAARSGADGRGPQNWYQDVHGKPANNLPAHDVGPVLPRGGWRGNETGAPVQAGRGGYQQVDKLPSLVDVSKNRRSSVNEQDFLPPVGDEGSSSRRHSNF